MFFQIFLAALTLTSPAQASRISGFPIFHELKRFHLGGNGGWDYLAVDSDKRRLFIARNDRVMVIDLDKGTKLGEIPETDGAHGVALDPKQSLGFATGGRSGLVTVFSLSDLKVLSHVAVGQKPDAIVYDSATDNVFVFNGKSGDASVIDGKTQRVVSTIPLEGKPEFGVSDKKGKIFVNLEDKNMLAVIDAHKMKVLNHFPLNPCESPTGLSMDVKTQKLIVGCGNKLAVIVDAKSGKVLNTFDVGAGVDATAFDQNEKLAFVSAGEGKLSIIKESGSRGFEHFQDVPTPDGARTLAVDPQSGNIYLATAEFGPAENPAPGQEHPKRNILPDSFFIEVVGQ